MLEVDHKNEKANSVQSCNNYFFSLTKCRKCGSPKVEVKYHRKYLDDRAIQSIALSCECGRVELKLY